MSEFHNLLAEFSMSERNEILILLRKLVSRMSDNKGKIVNEFMACCNTFLTENQSLTTFNNTQKHPSPPPPNLLKTLVHPPHNIKVNDKPKTNSAIKSLPPPPPPLLKSSTPGIDNSLGNTPPTQAADIPRPLRPKALPGQGRRLRHLQWAKVPANAVVTTTNVGGVDAASSIQQNIWQGLECADRELSE